MKDFDVTVKLRNNRLLERREALGLSAPQLAEAAGITYGQYNAYEYLRRSPLNRFRPGEIKESAQRLCNYLMTVEFVQQMIEGGCSYCGESELRMTLDRIDNSQGHTRENVVAACIRCNYTRKDMPHGAWILLAPAMKVARECGLFGAWTGRTR